MTLAKNKDKFEITKKRSGRHAVTDHKGKPVNGADKVKILEDKGLVKKLTKKTALAATES